MRSALLAVCSDQSEGVLTLEARSDSRLQVVTLEENVQKFGLTYFGMTDKRQGIVHVIGPEQGFTLPGATMVCGDSHTSTHGAFGALAFGIGTSEVEHVLATQTILQSRSKNMRVQIDGQLGAGVTSKDVILHVIGQIGTAGGTGAVIEFCGEAVERMSMEARMSMCNMSIEGGARAGMIAPDDITFKYLEGRPLAPKGDDWQRAVDYWRTLKSDPGAKWDKVVLINASDIAPTVSWGTSPQDVVPITGNVPDPKDAPSDERKQAIERAVQYMALTPGMPMTDVKLDKVCIFYVRPVRIRALTRRARVAGVHWQLHQLAHRRPARRSQHHPWPKSRAHRASHGRPWLGSRQGPSRTRGSRRRLQGGRL